MNGEIKEMAIMMGLYAESIVDRAILKIICFGTDDDIKKVRESWPQVLKKYKDTADKEAEDGKNWITIDEFASLTGIKRGATTVRLRKGLISHRREGRFIRIPKREADFYSSHVKPSEFAKSKYLSPDTIRLHIKSGNLDAVKIGGMLYINKDAKIRGRTSERRGKNKNILRK